MRQPRSREKKELDAAKTEPQPPPPAEQSRRAEARDQAREERAAEDRSDRRGPEEGKKAKKKSRRQSRGESKAAAAAEAEAEIRSDQDRGAARQARAAAPGRGRRRARTRRRRSALPTARAASCRKARSTRCARVSANAGIRRPVPPNGGQLEVVVRVRFKPGRHGRGAAASRRGPGIAVRSGHGRERQARGPALPALYDAAGPIITSTGRTSRSPSIRTKCSAADADRAAGQQMIMRSNRLYRCASAALA